MACMTHLCCSCDYEWFDNNAKAKCPKCGSSSVNHSFDEQGDE